jgi:hypothetical protein
VVERLCFVDFVLSFHTTKINFTSYFLFDVFSRSCSKKKIFFKKKLFSIVVDEVLRGLLIFQESLSKKMGKALLLGLF